MSVAGQSALTIADLFARATDTSSQRSTSVDILQKSQETFGRIQSDLDSKSDKADKAKDKPEVTSKAQPFARINAAYAETGPAKAA